jgi:predicted nuclease of predicted toxin-antitoxin system
LKLLIDECCPRVVADVLENQGFDVVRVAQSRPGATDDDLVVQAHDEGRVIVTQDYDFGEIAVRHGRFGSGLVLIACQSLPPVERAARTARIMLDLADQLYGQMTIIELKRVRQRQIKPTRP